MPTLDVLLDPPTGDGSPSEKQHHGRPGTTGNFVMRQHEDVNKNKQSNSYAEGACKRCDVAAAISQCCPKISRRPATAGADTVSPLGASPNRHATFKLPPTHAIGDTGNGRSGSRGSRPTLEARFSVEPNCPSTSATVDYGFAREFYQNGADNGGKNERMIPYEGEVHNEDG